MSLGQVSIIVRRGGGDWEKPIRAVGLVRGGRGDPQPDAGGRQVDADGQLMLFDGALNYFEENLKGKYRKFWNRIIERLRQKGD
jgi:hypothetical protein